MRKLSILCDMDETIVDLINPWLDAFHRDTGHRLKEEAITYWEMEKCLPPGMNPDLFFRYLYEPGLFINAPAFPGGIEAVKSLIDEGHDVTILTSQTGHVSASEKLQWLEKHMPFISHKQVLLGHRKYLVKGDVLIDDGPHNIRSYRQHWPDSYITGIAFPYNECVTDLMDLRADSYKDTVSAWDKILGGIKELANEKN